MAAPSWQPASRTIAASVLAPVPVELTAVPLSPPTRGMFPFSRGLCLECDRRVVEQLVARARGPREGLGVEQREVVRGGVPALAGNRRVEELALRAVSGLQRVRHDLGEGDRAEQL